MKIPTFSFPPITTPTFSFAPIANITEKKADEDKEKEKEPEHPASPKKDVQPKVEAKSPEKPKEAAKEEAKEPAKELFTWPGPSSAPTQFKPVTAEGIPAPAKPWPEFTFPSVTSSAPAASSAPSTSPAKAGSGAWPSFDKPTQLPSFNFDSAPSLFGDKPFDFTSYVSKLTSKKDSEDEDEENSGSDDGSDDEEKDSTGVKGASRVFGQGIDKAVGESTGEGADAPAKDDGPAPIFEKKPVTTGEEGETTLIKVLFVLQILRKLLSLTFFPIRSAVNSSALRPRASPRLPHGRIVVLVASR